MDLDKIISELVDKRIKDELTGAVGCAFDKGNLVGKFVDDLILKKLEERKTEILKAIDTAINASLVDAHPRITFGYNTEFNMPTYRLRQLLKEAEEEGNVE
jgi:hypothetical protein